MVKDEELLIQVVTVLTVISLLSKKLALQIMKEEE